MLKVFKHTVLAERQAARRLAKRRAQNERQFARTEREQKLYARKLYTDNVQQASHNRREDYELGPLAPRRDVGSLVDKYGSVPGSMMRGHILTPKQLEDLLKPWGGKEFMNLVQGDRVVLLKGRDKGRIGKVKEIDIARGQLTVDGLNLADVQIPPYMQNPDDPNKSPFRAMEQALSLADVRLVFPLQKASDSAPRDVIIKEVIGRYFDRVKPPGKSSHRRFIANSDIEIPWPEKEPEVFTDHPADTLRIDVETRTFVPTLLRPPMPSTVIDELRNKFSAFRTRHDPEYIQAKEEEERAKIVKKEQIREMRTPLQELHRVERRLKKKLAKRLEMTPDMMRKLGAVMAAKKEINIAVGEKLAEKTPAVA